MGEDLRNGEAVGLEVDKKAGLGRSLDPIADEMHLDLARQAQPTIPHQPPRRGGVHHCVQGGEVGRGAIGFTADVETAVLAGNPGTIRLH
jgi:hypothetical protein